MKKTEFDNFQVDKVSAFLQDHMNKNRIDVLTPDECATLLAQNNILSNEIGPKPGFNFRQMLRDGRDGLINMINGAYQEKPNKRWLIYRQLDKKGSP